MNESLKAAMREILLDRYGIDIERAKCHFSTQNYAFVFPGEPFMIRVSATPKKTRGEILSELMWLDDLKQFKQTVCEPNVSLRGNLLEEFEIDGKTYRASMFRTARGVIKSTTDMTPLFFICVGDLLGAIHHVSTDERELGIKFKRQSKAGDFAALKARVADKVPASVMEKIERIEAQVNGLSQDIGRYGLCHGDFHMNNFFVEENNIWVFDFDGCAYAHYLYDIASFIQACFLCGYGAGRDLRKVMDEILHYFKIGYTLNHSCDEHFWDDLELFIAYRTALTYLSLCEIDNIGVVEDTNKIKQFFGFIVSQDDVMNAMTAAMGKGGRLI
ncbi:MAG: aminoglycoside phosphotransferase family protein [Clostridia bacterium]|nr:aminoglycoside phosphotransferase family protein [Clostridia bacterium]